MLGCSERKSDPERNVILETAPFYRTELRYDSSRAEAVITTVRSFSARHGMDFLLARESLRPGDFNASANGPSLNLKAMHIDGFHEGVAIFATARESPTPRDRALVGEFVAEVRQSAIAGGTTSGS